MCPHPGEPIQVFTMSDSHNHHSHDHGTENVSDRVLLWTIVINLGLSVFEFGAGAVAGSVALMADALHNTNDAGALIIAYVARRISRRGADQRFTFGYRRAELIGAMIQLTALIVVGLYLIYEAVSRFISPEPIVGVWVMAAASVALVVDVITAWLLWAMAKGSLNVKAAFVHNLSDALASVSVLLGGGVIYWLGWTWVDPVLTLIIAGYILYLSFGMLKRTSGILMEGSPPGFDFEALCVAAMEIDGVQNLHHVHVWELNEESLAFEGHVIIEDSALTRQDEIKRAFKLCLHDKFKIAHSTVEFERASEACKGEAQRLITEHN
jgi:cobalt-zinc-cadmium efflux system protein